MEETDIQTFYKLCEYCILDNLELSTGVPSNTKLQSTVRYLLIYLDISKSKNPLYHNSKVKDFLTSCAYNDEFISQVILRNETCDKLLVLLDYVETYLVDEIEKDMYGHGDKCYTYLFNNLELVIRIKQQKYNYKYKNVHDLLVNGYYFKKEIADKFVQLAASHTPEECPD